MSFGIPVRNGLGVGLLASTSLSTRGGGFSPASLFLAGEQGFIYDPSDFSTLYQDPAGTTPVTAVGQTVGLVLDKSRGLVLGPERLSVGFTVTQAGAPAATYNTVTGQGSVSRVSSSVRSYVRFNLTSTSFYRLTIQNTGGGSLEVSAAVGGGFVASGQTVTMFTSGASSPSIFASTDGTTVTFTVVSIKELPGNHATQSVLASRPILAREPLGGRRNLLTWTEQFDNAVWAKQAVTVAANSTTAPDGTATADTLVENTASLGHVAGSAMTAITALYVFSVYLKKGSGSTAPNWLQLYTGGVSSQYANFNLGTGAVGSVAAGSTATITSVGNGWYRCTLSFMPSSGGSASVAIAFTNNTDTTTRGPSYAGSTTSDVFIWGAQLEAGSTATAYQRVTSTYDVTEAGKADLYYLLFDGSDDFLVTPTITPGTDKAQVFAGVRKLSDAALAIVAETGTGIQNGSLFMGAPGAAAPSYRFFSRGTANGDAIGVTFTAPITNVLTGLGDISGDSAILRVNGTQAASSTVDQGTGNYLAYPAYIGRRGGTTLPFNGRIYSLIVRFGANLTAAQIAQTEAWVNSRTGAY